MSPAPSKHAAAAVEIRRVFSTAWQGGAIQLPLQLENTPFVQPHGAAWGRLSVVTGSTTAACLGAAMTRTPFILQLQVFVPEHQGTGIARQIADQVAVIDATVHRAAGLLVRFDTTAIEPTASQGGAAAFLITLPGTYDADPEISA